MNIKFYFPKEEEIHEYSLGNLDISIGDQLLSSSSYSRHEMMVFISLSELSNGIVNLLTDNSRKSYEFVGNDSSFQFLISRAQDKISITSSHKRITMQTTHEELVRALWQCWQDIEKCAEVISHNSSVYLDMIDAKALFKKTFTSII
jgi:hypothetical protein